MVIAIGAVLIFTTTQLLPFGTFPQREVGENLENSVGQYYLEKAPQETGSANVVTSIVWGYRGYDTLGEATVLFTAVTGVTMAFRAIRRRR